MDAQGSQASALEDTVYLALSSNESTDLSQRLTNLTAADLGGYETSSARTGITGARGRELYLRTTMADADGSYIMLSHGDPAVSTSNTYTIRRTVAATADIEFVQGATVVYTHADINANLAGTDDISIHWSTRDNPDTTGAGDAQISEFIIYNHTTPGYILEPKQATHAVSSTNAAWAFSVGGRWDGANLVSDSRQIIKCRVGDSWHTSVEFAEHWVAARTAPTADTEQIDDLLPLDKTSAIGDDGELVGQGNMGWTAAHNITKRRAMWGPLVNEHWSDAEVISTTADPTQWVTSAPDQTLYKLRVDMLRWCVVPPGCTHAWVRLHVVSYVTSGAAVPVQFRIYALNRPPLFDLVKYPDAPALEYSLVTSSLLTVDDVSPTAEGRWMFKSMIRLPVYTPATPGFQNTVHLVPAYAFDPGATSSNDANARILINSFHARMAVGVDQMGGYGG